MENSVSLAVPPMVPTCQILRTTAPSAWTSNSLTSMSSSAFSNCLELMGRDAFLTSYQRSQVLRRVRQVGFHFHARCVAELCFTLRLTTSTSSLSSPFLHLKINGPVSSFSQSVISQLGGVAVELSVQELSSLHLTDRRSIAAMGAVSAWSNRQVSSRLSNVECGQR